MASKTISNIWSVSEKVGTSTKDKWFACPISTLNSALNNTNNIPSNAKITGAKLYVKADFDCGMVFANVYIKYGFGGTSNINASLLGETKTTSTDPLYYPDSGVDVFKYLSSTLSPFAFSTANGSYLAFMFKSSNIFSKTYTINEVRLDITYEIPKYTITLNKGTGCASVSGGGTYDRGASATISCTSLPGYDIGGSGIVKWQDSAGNIVFDYTPQTFNIYQNYNLTCNIYPNVYFIEYSPGFYGDYINSTMERVFNAHYDEDFTIHSNTFFKVNTNHSITINFKDGDTISPMVKYREFDRWYSEDTGAYYTAGQVVKNLTATHGATITLTAQWKAPYFTVPTPADKDGYEFVGWEYQGTIYPPGASFKPKDNLISATAIAVWNRLKIEDVYGGNNKAGVYVANTECKAVYVGNTQVYG